MCYEKDFQMSSARLALWVPVCLVAALCLLILTGVYNLDNFFFSCNSPLLHPIGSGCTLWEYEGIYRWRPQEVRVIKIDLNNPAVDIEINGPGPKGGAAALPAREYHDRRNKELLPSRRCLVTLNGNVSGHISSGKIISFADPEYLLIHDWPQYCFGFEIFQDGRRRAFIRRMELKEGDVGKKPFKDVAGALLSWPYYAWPLIEKGRNQYLEESLDFAIIEERHPRTIAAIDRGGRFVFLAAVKGRDPLHAFGMTFVEAADFLLEHFPEISSAINLDGGFSTVMVISGPGKLSDIFPENHEPRLLGNVIQIIENEKRGELIPDR